MLEGDDERTSWIHAMTGATLALAIRGIGEHRVVQFDWCKLKLYVPEVKTFFESPVSISAYCYKGGYECRNVS